MAPPSPPGRMCLFAQRRVVGVNTKLLGAFEIMVVEAVFQVLFVQQPGAVVPAVGVPIPTRSEVFVE